MLSVKLYSNTFSNPYDDQSSKAYLTGLRRSAGLASQRPSRTSTFRTRAERHRAFLTTLLEGQSTPSPPNLCPAQADTTAAPLPRNEKYEGTDCKPT